MIDIFLVVMGLIALISGYRQGGLSAVLSLAGVILGGWAGVAILPWVMDRFDEFGWQDARLLGALLCITLCVVVAYSVGQLLGIRMRNAIRSKIALRIESLIGAAVGVLTVMLLAWLVLVPIAANQHNQYGQAVRDSRVLSGISSVAPEWVKRIPNQTSRFVNSSGFPIILDPTDGRSNREVEAPDPTIAEAPTSVATHSRVLRVLGTAYQCERMIQGSSWVVAEDTLLTNAHVVAGTDSVQVQDGDRTVDARVVYYNPQQDIAVLRTEGLGLEPLAWSDVQASSGTNAVVMGYPQGGPFVSTPVRIREELRISGPNIYGDARVERETYALRGQIVQGNSGGPLIDDKGEVLGLVFGADMNQHETGYALTREEVELQVGSLEQWQDSVDTGTCVRG